MKKLFNEFKEFIIQGNVIDLAIGIIIGAAFSSVVNSIVDNLLMPPLSLLIGNVNFQDLFLVLKKGEYPLPPNATLEMANELGALTLNYGKFLTDAISFILLGIGVFLIVKAINQLNKTAEELNLKVKTEDEQQEPSEKECPYCFERIAIKATRCPYCTSQLEN